MRTNQTICNARVRCVATLILAVLITTLSPSAIGAQEKTTPFKERPSVESDIQIRISLMDPKSASDIFGKRIGHRYVVMQVTIENKNKDFQFLIHDVSIDLTHIWQGSANEFKPNFKDVEEFKGKYQTSSQDKTLVRGVAEKGQVYDRRNLIIRLLEGVGAVAGGITGVATFGSSFAPSVAAFNGPLLTAVKNAFPDMTVNQMNRLSDTAYTANTLVAKQSSKVMVAFLPQAIFLNKELRDKFWANPIECFKWVDFRLAQALVDGSFIQELPNLEFTLDGVSIDEAQMAKFHTTGFEVTGTIRGNHLDSAKLALTAPTTLDLTQGDQDEKHIEFKLKSNSNSSVQEGTELVFAVTKDGKTKTRALAVSGQTPGPKLISLMDSEGKSEGKPGEKKTITINGSGFIGTPEVLFDPNGPIKAGTPREQTETSFTVDFQIAADAPKREYKVKVRVPRGVTDSLTFTIK